MTRYTPKLYPSPIALPEAASGPMRVRHRVEPPGASLPIVGMRQGMLRGVPPLRVRLTAPRLVHELVETDVGIWMTDLPEELNQIAELLAEARPRGRVLVGGLGLGVLTAVLERSLLVNAVVTVERLADVIRLCARPGSTVVHADLLTYLRDPATPPYDAYLLDTWQGTNEGTWWEHVFPLRRVIRQRWGPKPVIHCWAEDIMHGQLERTLTTCQPHWRMKYLPLPMPRREARRFLRTAGSRAWENKYGAAVDRATEAP